MSTWLSYLRSSRCKAADDLETKIENFIEHISTDEMIADDHNVTDKTVIASRLDATAMKMVFNPYVLGMHVVQIITKRFSVKQQEEHNVRDDSNQYFKSVKSTAEPVFGNSEYIVGVCLSKSSHDGLEDCLKRMIHKEVLSN